jgi:hypothetical protein
MLPREIITDLRTDRACFDLPRRPLGALRWIGLVPMAFAVFFAWMPAGQIIESISRMMERGIGGFDVFFIVFLSVFVVAAMMPFGFGLFILAGRTRIVINHTHLRSTEIAGPVRWTRRARLTDVERLEFGAGTQTDEKSKTPPLRKLSGIVALLRSGKKFPMAIGYPPGLINPLLPELQSALAQRGQTVPVQEAMFPDASGELLTETRVEKPTDSNIQMTTDGWTLELVAPSRGLWKESYGTLAFGLVWCAIVAVISTIILVSESKHGFPLGPLAFMALFDLIGIGMVLAGIHLGTRRCTLRVNSNELRVALKSALRSREWHWPKSDIETIGVGDSGTRVNNRVIEQLQVRERGKSRPTGLLSGRSWEELSWVATTLRRALGLIAAGEPEAPPRIDAARRQQ